MKPILTLIDQTLGCALKSKLLAMDDFANIKHEIAAMAPVIFDIPLESLSVRPGLSATELRDIRAIVPTDVTQLKIAHDLGCRQIRISFKPITQDISRLENILNEADKMHLDTALVYLNTAKHSLRTIALLEKINRDFSLKRLIIDDIDSRLDPFSTYRTLIYLRYNFFRELEFHGHNAFGLATGNTLGAVKSGLRYLAVSIGGLGGYPAFEEVLMGSKYLLQKPLYIPPNLAHNCKEILNRIGVQVSATKPIIGSRIFAHESGIHVDGVIKKSELYEPFSPETVGLARMFIIGKHSGTAAIEAKLRELNIEINPSFVPQVLEKVREFSIRQKAPVSDKQLPELIRETIL